MNETLGDRIKEYESQTTSQKLIKQLPVICRIDGKNFSTFSKGLKRPYDERLSNLMIETAKYVMKETNANCAYHQSDEISFVWYNEDYESEMLFDGKVYKLTSTIAAFATGFFNKHLAEYLPEKAHLIPSFDCRVFNVPNVTEAANAIYWRELDATKNAISMAAQCYYSPAQLEGKNSSDKQEMLFQKGINFNDYPSFFKRGTYIQRKRVLTKFSVEELEKLPLKHQARSNPDLEIERWVIDKANLPPLGSVENKVDVILFGAEPILKTKLEIIIQ